LKNPFIISFNKKLQYNNKEEIFDLFLINLKGTLFRKIEKTDKNKIIIKGDLISLNPLDNIPWNLWIGFSKKAELYVTENNTIVYSIDYKYGMIYSILALSFFILTPFIFSFSIDKFYLLFLLIISSILCLNILLKIFLHWRIFDKTLKLENTYKGNYNWSEILKNKSDKELRKIINGNTTLTIEVQKMAKEELIRRKNN